MRGYRYSRMISFIVEASHHDYPLSLEQVSAYRRDGFISLSDVFAGEELIELRNATRHDQKVCWTAKSFTADRKS